VSRKALLGDPLTDAIEYFANNPNDPKAISNLCAELIGRCASQAASAVVPAYEQIAELRKQIEKARDAD